MTEVTKTNGKNYKREQIQKDGTKDGEVGRERDREMHIFIPRRIYNSSTKDTIDCDIISSGEKNLSLLNRCIASIHATGERIPKRLLEYNNLFYFLI